jgi:hypothetical protein
MLPNTWKRTDITHDFFERHPENAARQGLADVKEWRYRETGLRRPVRIIGLERYVLSPGKGKRSLNLTVEYLLIDRGFSR